MNSEETPLLRDQLQSNLDPTQSVLPSENVYSRFSREKKQAILIIVSLTGLLPMFISGCFVPSIPQIAKDLDATPATVSLGVSVSMFASSISVMFWSAYASFYGRRTIYLCGMPITILGSFGVAASTNVESLLFWRFVQTFGCACGSAIGAATIGDIYQLEERGTAMGTFLDATLAGLAIAPSVGGILAQYWSWRSFQVALGAWSALQTFLLFLFLPETAHPGSRGIDDVRSRRKLFAYINPLRCLAFLRSPNIFMITLAYTFALMTDYVLLIPLAYTVGAKYGIVSEGMIGILFLPNGFGNLVGAPIAGRISDVAVRKAKEERKGVWIPEDRLRAVWLGGLIFLPISVTLAGLTTTYISGTMGLAINLVCLFTNGIGVNMVLTPIGAYSVDIMPSRSAEVKAAISAFRSLLLVPLSALCIPAIETIGVAATNSISGALALLGSFLIWLTIRYGEQMRSYVDIGYPSFDPQTRASKHVNNAMQH